MKAILRVLTWINNWLFPELTDVLVFNKIGGIYGVDYTDVFTNASHKRIRWTQQEAEWFYAWYADRLYIEGYDNEQSQQFLERFEKIYGFIQEEPSSGNLLRRARCYLRMLWIFG